MEVCELLSYSAKTDKDLRQWENSKASASVFVTSFSDEGDDKEEPKNGDSPDISFNVMFKTEPTPQIDIKQDTTNNSSSINNNPFIHFDPVEVDDDDDDNEKHSQPSGDIINSNQQDMLDPDSLPVPSDEWYSFLPFTDCGCPFIKLHHGGLPTEFLHCPLPRTNNDTRSKQILAGMNDISTGVSIKVQFIVNNLNDCLGIWPQLFLQKLNAILVHGDQATIITILTKDDFAIFKQLVSYYTKETKCSMVFRYFCFLYNAFSRNIIQVLPSIIKNQLLVQLQIEFSLAVQDSCRCKSNHRCTCLCEPDEEHRNVGSLEQLKITAILMYYLVCKIGNHAVNANDIYEGTYTQLNAEVSKFIEGYIVPLYIKLYENAKANGESPAATNLMELLSHLLIAYNCMPYQKTNGFVSAVHKMLDMGYLSSAVMMKDTFLSIFKRETDAIYKEAPGSRLMFSVPEIKLNFTTLGLPGVIMTLHNVVSEIEYSILTRDEMVSLMDTVVSIQMHLSQNGLWNGDYENIYLHCHRILGVLQKKLGNPVSLAEIKLDSDDADSANENLNSLPTPVLLDSSTSASSSTSQTKLHPQRAKEGGTYVNDNDSEDDDGWATDTRRISKMRKGYENEIDGLVPGKSRKFLNWISSGIVRLAENCAKICKGNGITEQ